MLKCRKQIHYSSSKFSLSGGIMKRFLVLFFTLWAFVAFSSFSQGEEIPATPQDKELPKVEEIKPPWVAIGVRSTYFIMDHHYKPIVGNLVDMAEYQNYYPINANIQVNLSKYFALELSGNQFKAMALNSDYHYFASDCDLQWTSIMLGLQFRWPHFHKSFVPYIIGGLSYNINTIKKNNWYYYGFPDPDTYNNWTSQGNKPEDWPNNGYRRIHSVEDSYGGFIGLGADYFLTKHWAINMDCRYHWSQVNWTYQLINNDGELGGARGTVLLDSWILGLGIKYFF